MRVPIPRRSGPALTCLALAATAACVPRGAPPSGRQLLADRLSTPIGFVAPTGDGITRVLVTRQAADNVSVDLSVVSVDAAGGAPDQQLLAANLPGDFSANCQPGPYACTDARGRLIVATDTSAGARPAYARIDPVTGARLDLGVIGSHMLSPSGERLLVYPATPDGSTSVYEFDDSVVQIGPTTGVVFVGEVLYYLTPQHTLMRLAAGGASELVATNVSTFIAPVTTGDPLLLLGRPTADPDVTAASILNLATNHEAPLPAGTPLYAFSVSPDGQWITALNRDSSTLTFIDQTGTVRDSFTPGFQVSYWTWRPGHAELWLADSQQQDPTVWIVRPTLPPQQINAFIWGSTFTADGRYWLSSTGQFITDGTVQIGDADDPAGPRVDLLPARENVFQFWQLPDGRLLVEAWTSTPEINNVFAVDPTTGDWQSMGEQCVVMAAGDTRAVVNQHLATHQGDLTVFDLSTGGSTVLAPEFTTTAVVEQVGQDTAAPGAPIAYRFQARFPSPYDGVWLATVP